MHGEEGDQGTGIFHKTEFVGPIWTGGLASEDTPEQFGPRNIGQAGVAPLTTEMPAANVKQ